MVLGPICTEQGVLKNININICNCNYTLYLLQPRSVVATLKGIMFILWYYNLYLLGLCRLPDAYQIIHNRIYVQCRFHQKYEHQQICIVPNRTTHCRKLVVPDILWKLNFLQSSRIILTTVGSNSRQFTQSLITFDISSDSLSWFIVIKGCPKKCFILR